MKLITYSSYIYLHSFPSIPQFTKAKDLCDHLTQIKIKLKIPYLNPGDFPNMTITSQINQVSAEFIDHYAPVTLIISSLAGLISAHLVQ
ncbi:YqiA/YcfP family alpha/beta fold hydrolase [Trichormus azollae]|uniref:YqiA/YcfP family alpha/beta fold hydrolase n=1 Tax=Trichormus azollae TaxID=1164 RepID=UPI00325F41CA